jgi:hypothetical protein
MARNSRKFPRRGLGAEADFSPAILSPENGDDEPGQGLAGNPFLEENSRPQGHHEGQHGGDQAGLGGGGKFQGLGLEDEVYAGLADCHEKEVF